MSINQKKISSFLQCRIDIFKLQASGLGPILFLLFINGLSTATEQFFNLFADDTSVYGGEGGIDGFHLLLQKSLTNTSILFFFKTNAM